MVVNTFSSISGGRDKQISEFEATLAYRASSWTAKATKRYPVSEKQKTKQTKTQKTQAKS